MDAIPAGDYYRPVTEELCQGDIFGCVPLVRMREQPRVLKTVMLSPKRSVYEFDEAFDANVAAPADRKNRNVLSICDFTSGILFTHDCEIDKGRQRISLSPSSGLSIQRFYRIWRRLNGSAKTRNLPSTICPPALRGGLSVMWISGASSALIPACSGLSIRFDD